MSTTETVLEMVKRLTPEQQQKVIEYVQLLQQEKTAEATNSKVGDFRQHPFFGMWKDREDMEDVTEWRKRLWRRD